MSEETAVAALTICVVVTLFGIATCTPQHPAVITKCVSGTPVFIPTEDGITTGLKGRWM